MIFLYFDENKKTKVWLLLLIFICTLTIVILGCTRERLHSDEVWSFGLSNSHYKPFFYTPWYGVGDSILQDESSFDYQKEQDYLEHFYHWNSSEYYHDYVTVQAGEQFDYDSVYSNQVADTHPPLYYFIINTICSLFPDSFSIQYGLIPNYVFYAISLLLLFYISKDILNSNILAFLTILLWGLSRAGITEALFIRMYMMSACLSLCLIFLNLKMLKDFNWKYIVFSVIIEILGFLTHYYVYVVAFFLTFFTCLYYLFKRQISKMFIYGLSGVFAVCTSMALFPAVIRHLTQGVWAGTTQYNFGRFLTLYSDLCSLLNQIVAYYLGIELNFTMLLNIICLIVVIVLFVKSIKRYKNDKTPEISDEVLFKGYLSKITKKCISWLKNCIDKSPGGSIFLMVVLCSGLLISKLEPNMDEWTIRYLFVVLPMFALLLVWLLAAVVNKVIKTKKSVKPIAVIAICILMMIVGSNILQTNIVLKPDQQFDSSLFSDEYVIVANNTTHFEHTFSYLYLDAKSIFPIDRAYSRLTDALIVFKQGDKFIFIVCSELASKDEMDAFLSGIEEITYSYIDANYYPLESNSLYYVYRLIVN